MSDSASPVPPTSKRRRGRRELRYVTSLIVMVILSAYLGVDVITGILKGEKTGVFISLMGALIGVLLVLASSVTRGREEESIGESRQRLTRAEGALEAALRSAQSTPSTRLGASLRDAHGWLPLQVETGNANASRVGVDEAPADSGTPEVPAPAQRSLGLPELWEATHARLTLYHDIATGQAKTSFRNAQVSMAIGFVLLVVFVALALNASTAIGAIVAGALGAVSAALSGFVSRTFIRSQEAAATHLRSYFDQPLELSRYLAAERLISDGDLTSEQRAEVLTVLVQAMVTPPAAVPEQQQGP